MLGKVTNIANLGIKSGVNNCNYQVFRMRNGQSQEAQYPIGETFTIEEDGSAKGMILIDPEGDRIWVPAGEQQCFREID